MEQQATFQVIFNGETHQFQTGSHLFIFDCGLFWDMHSFGMDEFKRYIQFVYDCYLEADDPIPLGSLSDYVAEEWECIKECGLSILDVLKNFWNQLHY